MEPYNRNWLHSCQLLFHDKAVSLVQETTFTKIERALVETGALLGGVKGIRPPATQVDHLATQGIAFGTRLRARHYTKKQIEKQKSPPFGEDFVWWS